MSERDVKLLRLIVAYGGERFQQGIQFPLNKAECEKCRQSVGKTFAEIVDILNGEGGAG